MGKKEKGLSEADWTQQKGTPLGWSPTNVAAFEQRISKPFTHKQSLLPALEGQEEGIIILARRIERGRVLSVSKAMTEGARSTPVLAIEQYTLERW